MGLLRHFCALLSCPPSLALASLLTVGDDSETCAALSEGGGHSSEDAVWRLDADSPDTEAVAPELVGREATDTTRVEGLELVRVAEEDPLAVCGDTSEGGGGWSGAAVARRLLAVEEGRVDVSIQGMLASVHL